MPATSTDVCGSGVPDNSKDIQPARVEQTYTRDKNHWPKSIVSDKHRSVKRSRGQAVFAELLLLSSAAHTPAR